MKESNLSFKDVGLVVEGGGFRGIFTAGVLDYFLEQDWEFPYVIGVSMGACNAANYISKQIKRSVDIPYRFMKDDRYISIKNLITKRSLFGMDFIFNEIPYKHNVFDFETYRHSRQTFLIGAMDVRTGRSEFFNAHDLDEKEMLEALKASCSLPFISPIVSVREGLFLDGGLADSIPLKKVFDDGFKKAVVLVTREKGYRKKTTKKRLGNLFYRRYPKVVENVFNRSRKYNEEVDYIEKMAEEGKAFIIYPKKPIKIGRTEKNPGKLMEAYIDGYKRAKELHHELKAFING